MTTPGNEGDLRVLTLEVVRAGLDALRGQRIHEHFPAYLHLRQRAISGRSFTDIEPVWREVGDLLGVPGGPPTKPHYRPFSSRHVQDPGVYWFNRNLAGSYAPRSIRSTSRFMLNSTGDGFALPHDHAQQALRVLLLGTRVPAWALAAYYLRNYGFTLESDGGLDDLIQAFRIEFLFEADLSSLSEADPEALFGGTGRDTDFEVLFDGDTRPAFTGPRFEPLSTVSDDQGGAHA